MWQVDPVDTTTTAARFHVITTGEINIVEKYEELKTNIADGNEAYIIEVEVRWKDNWCAFC